MFAVCPPCCGQTKKRKGSLKAEKFRRDKDSQETTKTDAKRLEQLYLEVHPSDNLGTIPGVGAHTAPIFPGNGRRSGTLSEPVFFRQLLRDSTGGEPIGWLRSQRIKND